MRALVTGAAGFVGRHTVNELDRRGWDTVGIDIDPMGGMSTATDAIHFFATSAARFDLVVHAAASAPHRAAIDGEPEHYIRNLHLDAAMFDWAVRTQQRRVLYLSSSATYPVLYQAPHAYREPLYESMVDLDDPMEPDAAYGWTKITGEKMAAAARAKGVSVTVVRPFSGYGEDQSTNFPFRAITDRVKARESPLRVWGDGSQVRDWIHISDVVAGMLAVVESGTKKPVNLCTGEGTSMFELALIAARLAGHRADVMAMPDRPAGVAYRVGDPELFHTIYRPKVSLEEGVIRALRATPS